MSIALQTHVEKRLHSDKIIWLITVRPDGRPHCVPVWFLWDSEMILIFSKPNTRKVRNIRQNRSVVLALDDTKNGLDVVILEGATELLQKGDKSAILQTYGEKYHEGLHSIGVSVEAFTTLYSQPICVIPVRAINGQ